uniref:Uncharacterized protein n=1 Tax=Panagrolaimus sp. ES5 TaxID=591445 RepID=A0AC34F3Y0_9BILA
MFEKLIKTAQQMQPIEVPKKCSCKCQCGYYPPETELTAASSPGIPKPDTPGSSKSLSYGLANMTLPEPKQFTESILQNIPKNPQPFTMIPTPAFPSNVYNPWYMTPDPTTLQHYMTRISNPNYITPTTQSPFCSYDPLQHLNPTPTEYPGNIAAPNRSNIVFSILFYV